ncbi:unnamed protein product [Phytomonas sp. EM1]|nr:unnamed protein product [Phytomonas sp. EM1]|eukprot:CCW59787.1 unnamed protein product [Phytomonas sp. isolate EM1]
MLPQTLQPKKGVDDIWPVNGKRVLIRVDFNVNIRTGVIENDYRIRLAIPTISRILDQGGICILMSHLGQPKSVDINTAAMIREECQQRKKHILSYDGGSKISFFEKLSGEDKALILSWSSRKEKLMSLSVNPGSGKTAVFAKLPDEEKKHLIARFIKESTERVFQKPFQTTKSEQEFSLRLVGERLAELLDQRVFFAYDCLNARKEIKKLGPGDVMLLENLALYEEENSTDENKRLQMAQILASYGDIYINDAFTLVQSEAASITGIPKVMGHGVAGYFMDKEISYWIQLLNKPARPLTLIVGGSSLSSKIWLIDYMLTLVDSLIIGGGVALPFLKAQGHPTGATKCDEEIVRRARKVLKTAHERKVNVHLPVDHLCHNDPSPTARPMITNDANIPDGFTALDIGPKTISTFAKVIGSSKSVIWNGPMGMFEMPCYSKGTFAIAKVIGDATVRRGLLSTIIGGDTTIAAERCEQVARVSHVWASTVALDLLEGKLLPGIGALDNKD